MRSEAGAAWEGGCARRIAVLRSVCPRPDTAVILYVFSVRGAGGELFARAAQKAPCFIAYLLPPRPVGDSREFCEKRGFRKIPRRGRRPSWPPETLYCARRIAVLRSVCPRPDTAVILYVFSVRGLGGGLFARAAQKAPLLVPRHPLPPPLSLNEVGMGWGWDTMAQNTRKRWRLG